ncbi:hypothetical protein D3C72_1639090 [compost metagenome]
MRGTLGGQALGDLQAIHRVHPGEVLGQRLGLVRLDRADEVPDHIQVGEFGLLGQGFLQVVLAEVALAAGAGVAQGIRRLALAHRQQLYRLRIASGCLRRLTDARSDLCNIVVDRGHLLPLPARPLAVAAFYPLVCDWGPPWILPSCWPSAPSRAHRTCTSPPVCRR